MGLSYEHRSLYWSVKTQKNAGKRDANAAIEYGVLTTNLRIITKEHIE